MSFLSFTDTGFRRNGKRDHSRRANRTKLPPLRQKTNFGPQIPHPKQAPTFQIKESMGFSRPPSAGNQPALVFQAHIHNHLPPAREEDACRAKRTPLPIIETRAQRLQRLQKERDRKLMYAKLLSMFLFLKLGVITYCY